MAEKTFNSRLKNKIDTYEQWTANDPVLLSGELALVEISVKQPGTVNTVPSVMAKIGNGTAKFSELGWLYARASDIAEWAKSATKPTYEASEISGLADFISGEIKDSNTKYQLLKVDDYTYKLQSKEINDTDWTDISTINIPNDSAAIASLQNLVGDKPVGEQISSAIGSVQTEIDTLKGTGAGSIKKSIDDAFNDFSTKVTDDGVVNSYKELIDYAAEHGSEFTELVGDVSALEGLVGDTSVGDQISTAIDNANLSQYAKAADLATAEGKITTLEGKAHTHDNKSVLDGITSDKVSDWDSKAADDHKHNINVIEQTENDVIIFNCGTSSTVM